MTYHFIGIGGIGMSALARILLKQGYRVTGSDSSRSSITDELAKEGAQIFIGHNETNLSDGTVIYNSAIKAQNPEFAKAKKLGLPLLHRADLLKTLCKEKLPLLVTGTHGKTTTTALLASVLMVEHDPSFVVGGVIQSLQVNGRCGNGKYFVAEADESDGSFLKTKAYGAIVTNCENDHLDYWKTEEALNHGFREFCSSVQEHLFWCKDDERLCSFQPKGFSYGFSKDADLKILSWRQNPNGVVFDLEFSGHIYRNIFLPLFGRHNVLNGAAVFGLSLQLGVSENTVRQGFAQFCGVKRRLEKKGEAHGVVCYDDYGHHPTEIQATLKALRAVAGNRRVVVLFQPHRYSRTKDLWDEFLISFKDADVVFVTDVYCAGEAPIDGITGERLASEMGAFYGSEVILRPFDVFLTLGAGDVTNRGIPILNELAKGAPKLKVGVISGGTSLEHPVSLMSAKNITESLDRTLYEVESFLIPKDGNWVTLEVIEKLKSCDVVIPVLHGPEGEDGMIQGFLQTLKIPYVGCDYASCALCMNKAWTKQVASAHGIPVVPYIELDRETYRKNPIVSVQSFPVWVKAVHLGSSFGVSRAKNAEELKKAIELSFSMDDYLIIEKEIRGREIEFAVLGNEVLRVAEPCEILNQGAFYDYEKKYGKQASGVQVPAQITELQKMVGMDLAKRAYKAARCKGLTRIDFFLDGNGNFWLNEMNPFPGFTAGSGYPKMWEKSGLNQKELLNELVILALSKICVRY